LRAASWYVCHSPALGAAHFVRAHEKRVCVLWLCFARILTGAAGGGWPALREAGRRALEGAREGGRRLWFALQPFALLVQWAHRSQDRLRICAPGPVPIFCQYAEDPREDALLLKRCVDANMDYASRDLDGTPLAVMICASYPATTMIVSVPPPPLACAGTTFRVFPGEHVEWSESSALVTSGCTHKGEALHPLYVYATLLQYDCCTH
jgi:hypothetical protein